MKALLVSPKGSVSYNHEFLHFWNNNSIVRPYRETFTGVSIGLLILASFMKNDFEITFIDENKSDINFNEYYDLVAISCMTQQSIRAYQIADEFRKRTMKVIIGGIHPTLLRYEAKKHADSVFVGEVENIWKNFREDFFRNNIKPFYISESPCDMKSIPIPSYELLNQNDYKVVWVQTTRGCPHKCEFCVSSNVFGSKYRHKEIDQVIEEIKKIKNIWKKPIMISFADDNMFVNRKFSSELLKKLIPLNIRWFAQTDISVAQDDKLLSLMKKSGAGVLFIGFETLTKKGLSFIDFTNWKTNQLKKYKYSIKNIQNHGIGIMGAFIVGLDSDTKRTLNNISKFIINNHIYASQITLLTPFPGTRLRTKLEEEDRIITSNWEKYTIWDVVYKPKKMTVEELEKEWLNIYKKIYNKKVQLSNAKYFKKIFLKNA